MLYNFSFLQFNLPKNTLKYPPSFMDTAMKMGFNSINIHIVPTVYQVLDNVPDPKTNYEHDRNGFSPLEIDSQIIKHAFNNAVL